MEVAVRAWGSPWQLPAAGRKLATRKLAARVRTEELTELEVGYAAQAS